MKTELESYKKKNLSAAYGAEAAVHGAEAADRVAPTLDKYKAKQEDIDRKYGVMEKSEREAHDAAIRQQAAARSAAKREAYIAHERLQKYLPQARAVQGIEGMGMTETAKVQGLNAYLTNRSAADAAYASGVADLEAEKLRAQTERDLARASEESAARDTYLAERGSILEKYRLEQEAEAKEEAKAKSTAVGTMLSEMAEQQYGADGKMSQEGYNTLAAYLDANRDKVSPLDAELYDMTLEGYRKQIRSEVEQEAFDRDAFTVKNATFADISKFEDNKNLTVKVGGNSYRVQLNAPGDAPVSDATVTAAARQAREGDVFGLGGKLYLKHNGEIYGIEERSNSAKGEYTALYELFFGDGSNGGASQNQVQTLSAYQNTYGTGNTITVPDTYGQQKTVRVTGEATGIGNAGVKVDTLKPGVIYYVRGSKIIKGDDGRVYFVN